MPNATYQTAPSKADNKVRLSPDVLEKAERIAAEWGLKNARAAVEAVFRKYCDDYLHGRPNSSPWSSSRPLFEGRATSGQTVPAYGEMPAPADPPPPCDALDALDQLLAM